MTEDASTALTVDFHGDQIVTFEKDGKPYVAMRRVVENLGLGWGSQRQKLVDQTAKYHCDDIVTVDAAGRAYPMFAIPLAKLPLWLASINPNKIPDPAVREKLELYQAESAIALHDYWTKGLAINRQRLETDEAARERAIDELRKLRTSDRVMYRKITDAIAATSYDYQWEQENRPQRVRSFFAVIKDTFHVAVSGKTARALVIDNVDGTKPLLGMTSYDGDPAKITERDVKTGMNYLDRNAFARLQNLYEQLFLFAEQHMLRGQQMALVTWEERLNSLLKANGYEPFTLYADYLAPVADKRVREEMKVYKQRLKELAAT